MKKESDFSHIHPTNLKFPSAQQPRQASRNHQELRKAGVPLHASPRLCTRGGEDHHQQEAQPHPQRRWRHRSVICRPLKELWVIYQVTWACLCVVASYDCCSSLSSFCFFFLSLSFLPFFLIFFLLLLLLFPFSLFLLFLLSFLIY